MGKTFKELKRRNPVARELYTNDAYNHKVFDDGRRTRLKQKLRHELEEQLEEINQEEVDDDASAPRSN